MSIHTIELDVRPQLRSKIEPFDLIMGTIKELKKEDMFILHATLKPTPLLGLMKLRGFSNKVVKMADDHYITTFVHRSKKHLLQEGAAEAAAQEEPEEEDSAHCEASAGGHRLITLDNRGLEPPQPMIRTLAELDRMGLSDVLVITNDRVPAFLIEELKQRGCSYQVEMLGEGEQARVTIKKH